MYQQYQQQPQLGLGAGLQMHVPNLPHYSNGAEAGQRRWADLASTCLPAFWCSSCLPSSCRCCCAGRTVLPALSASTSICCTASTTLTNSCEPWLLAIRSCCRCHTVTQCRHTILLLEHYVTLCHAMSHIDTSSYLESVTLHLCQH